MLQKHEELATKFSFILQKRKNITSNFSFLKY